MAFFLIPAMNQTHSVEAAGSVCKIDELSDAPCYSLCIPGKVLGLGTSLFSAHPNVLQQPCTKKGLHRRQALLQRRSRGRDFVQPPRNSAAKSQPCCCRNAARRFPSLGAADVVHALLVVPVPG